MRNDHGVIELVAGDQLNLGANSQILAQGDNSAGGSAGGQVTLQSQNIFSDVTGSQITTAGGVQGGNGGNIEVSAPNIQSLNSAMDAGAQAGFTGGAFLLDPANINLGTSGNGVVPNNGAVAYNSAPGTLNLNVNTAFLNKNFSQILLQATGNINLTDGTVWDLSGSTGMNTGQLTLQAGGDVNIGNGSQITDANNWSVSLQAGYNFNNHSITPGTGSINFSDGSSIQTAAGAINLQAGQDISLGTAALNVTGGGSISAVATSGSVTIDSGSVQTESGNIALNAGQSIQDNSGSINTLAGGNISAIAGTDIAFGGAVAATGSGSVTAQANGGSLTIDPGSIQTSAGAIDLTAQQDITVGAGYVITTGGGSITAHALFGSIDTGSDAQGYHFTSNAGSLSQAYNLSDGLGGIGTEAGGNVNLTAGGDVTSVLPANRGFYYDGGFVPAQNSDYTTAGCGAYGPEAGNVTIIAGGNVTGNYLVANGTGKIFAGVEMDANGNPVQNAAGNYVLGSAGSAGTSLSKPNLALNLISGGWDVTAAQNIILQEVRNPNGIFNVAGGAALNHYFDYAPGDFVNLTAGNLVQLGASSSILPRVGTLKVPMIYPSILNITAGAGGVNFVGDFFYNQLILFPSPQGSLTINTTDGGSLNGQLPTSGGAPQIFNVIVSDSGQNQYLASGTFGANDHAATPVHLNNETPINLNIAGDMDLVSLVVPEAAQITVGGNMNNCRFQGMNLSAGDVSSIAVTGDIINRSAFTSVNLSGVTGAGTPNLSVLGQAYNNAVGGTSISAATLATSLFYNPTTQTLTYQNIPGVSLAGLLALLQNLTVQKLDANGQPELDASGNPITEQVSVISSAAANALLAEYNSLGPIPAGTGGYVIGGGGTFDLSAHNMDLGTTAGILSEGVGLYQVGNTYPLAGIFSHGAAININVTGNLDMYSSAIASLNGANIAIRAGGVVNVGSSEFTVTAAGARGIYTTGLGNVSVIADGTIDVNGSRIAAYEGGNVTVESLLGNVNAGSGGSGFAVVNSYSVNAGTVTAISPTIPGSGILATTFPTDRGQAVGSILVEAPNGSVNASAGGIVQLPLNGVNTASSIVEVLAGYELRDSAGNPVSAANIGAGTLVQVSANQNIDASGSGVLGSTVRLQATGNVTGLIFARNNIDISAQQNVNVTALAQGSVNVNSGGTISGTIIGVGGINASGGSIDANLESNQGISGDTSGSKGLAQGTAANSTSSAASASDATSTAAKSDTGEDDDLLKKKKPITLARKVSRVTVLLPKKN